MQKRTIQSVSWILIAISLILLVGDTLTITKVLAALTLSISAYNLYSLKKE